MLVPGVTDAPDNVDGVARFVAGLDNVDHVDVLPYHRMAAEKYQRLGLAFPWRVCFPPARRCWIGSTPSSGRTASPASDRRGTPGRFAAGSPVSKPLAGRVAAPVRRSREALGRGSRPGGRRRGAAANG
ncbi:hypothetical protein [Streptosporangium sp. G12]